MSRGPVDRDVPDWVLEAFFWFCFVLFGFMFAMAYLESRP